MSRQIGYQPFQTQNVKLDFPRFDGSDPLQWLFRDDQFFHFYSTPDDQRLTIVAVHMEGLVVTWFQMMQNANQIRTWVELSKAIELHFDPSQFECPRAKLFKLVQHTTVSEYYKEFMILANRVDSLTEDALLDCFTSGLKADIKRDVIAQSPSSLLRAVSLARLFDEKNLVGVSHSVNRSFSQPPRPISVVLPTSPWKPSVLRTSSNLQTKSQLPPLLHTPSSKPLPSIKKMTSAEMQLRREKGLCYTCDDKFS